MCWDFSLPLSHTPPLPSLLCGSSKSFIRVKDYSTAAHRCAARIQDPIQTDLLLQFWLDQRSEVIVDHRTCTSTRRCYTCGTRVVTPRSTRPWDRLRWLHHQRLCGSVIPAFGLRGYITKTLIVAALLIDRSWAFWVV
jgi:hypothetical protein